MYCKNCGKEVEGEAKFCPFCGTKMGAVTQPESKKQSVDQQAQRQDQWNVQPAPAASKKPQTKKKIYAWQTVLMILGGLLLLIIIVSAASCSGGGSGGYSDSDYFEDYAYYDSGTEMATDDVADTAEPENVGTGSTIAFGVYEQDNNLLNGMEPVEWIVLEEQEDKLLLLSKAVLDASVYSMWDEGDVVWEDSYLYYHLTELMQEDIFSGLDVSQVITNGTVETESGTYQSANELFLLNTEEILHYTKKMQDETGAFWVHLAEPTQYAKEMNVNVYTNEDNPEYVGKAYYWVREACRYGAEMSPVGNSLVNTEYDQMNFSGVRPAVWIRKEATEKENTLETETAEEKKPVTTEKIYGVWYSSIPGDTHTVTIQPDGQLIVAAEGESVYLNYISSGENSIISDVWEFVYSNETLLFFENGVQAEFVYVRTPQMQDAVPETTQTGAASYEELKQILSSNVVTARQVNAMTTGMKVTAIADHITAQEDYMDEQAYWQRITDLVSKSDEEFAQYLNNDVFAGATLRITITDVLSVPEYPQQRLQEAGEYDLSADNVFSQYARELSQAEMCWIAVGEVHLENGETSYLVTEEAAFHSPLYIYLINGRYYWEWAELSV